MAQQLRNTTKLDRVVKWFKKEVPEKTYLLEKPPHPKEFPFPWFYRYYWKPTWRFLERQGVYFYNNVLNKTEIGLYPKEWNPRVHGIYCHWRYYGTNTDVPVWDVKIKELPAWFGRRNYAPRAIWMELRRMFYKGHFDYNYGPTHGSFIEYMFRLLFTWIFISWVISTIIHKFRFMDNALYHW